jgi:hypothetical protein
MQSDIVSFQIGVLFGNILFILIPMKIVELFGRVLVTTAQKYHPLF